jgi:TM2 domain-containing membrane protein YozV
MVGPAMSGATFGRKGAGPDADLAARRAAFLAQERARPKTEPAVEDGGFSRSPMVERRYVSLKTNGTAYLLWLFLGGCSAHRFYLGFTTSAIIQLLLSPIGYAMLMSKSPAGLAFIAAGALWLLGDAFMIPAMVSKANERARGLSLGSTFA